MVRWLGLIGACCASSAALAQAEAVRITKDQSTLAGCQRLGEVGGSSVMGGIMQTLAYDSALKEMREKTLAAGGTHLLIIDLTTGYSGANGYGEAYRCEPTTEPATKSRRKR